MFGFLARRREERQEALDQAEILNVPGEEVPWFISVWINDKWMQHCKLDGTTFHAWYPYSEPAAETTVVIRHLVSECDYGYVVWTSLLTEILPGTHLHMPIIRAEREHVFKLDKTIRHIGRLPF